MILFSHRRDTQNPGDLYATPKEYFSDLKGPVVDVFDDNSSLKKEKVQTYITGGGDILVTQKWINYNKDVLQYINPKYKIVWGAGVNFKSEIERYLLEFDLIGTRVHKKEYPNSKYHYVPCVSCLHPIFKSIKTKPEYKVAVIDHFKRAVEDVPDSICDIRIKNKPTDFNTMIQTIAKSETVITSSYHATYWSMLLNKRTLTYLHKDDCKLSTFKAKPIYFRTQQFHSDMLKREYDYSGYLDECIKINKDFHKKVLNYVN